MYSPSQFTRGNVTGAEVANQWPSIYFGIAPRFYK